MGCRKQHVTYVHSIGKFKVISPNRYYYREAQSPNCSRARGARRQVDTVIRSTTPFGAPVTFVFNDTFFSVP